MIDFVTKLNSFKHIFRAESVIVDLINQGYNPDDIIIEFEGNHKKNWDYDILNCHSQGRKFIFNLSRNGLFQSLPEYLFLRPIEGSKDEKEKIIAFNANQKRNASIFLDPIDNLIFQESVKIETHENKILFSLETYDLASLEEFWRIDPGINKTFKIKLIKILPYLHSIIGNYELTTRCLEFFLDSPVEFSIIEKQIPISIPGNEDSSGLGSSYCGEDLIMSGDFFVSSFVWLFKVRPTSESEIEQYLENGEKRKIIEYFYNYFVPFEYNMEIEFVSADNSEGFSLNDAYLGFNT